MKIAAKINLTFATIFIVVMFVVGTIITTYSLNTFKKQVFDDLYYYGQAMAENVRLLIDEQKEAGAILAGASVYRDFLKEPKDSPNYPIIKAKIDARLERTLLVDENMLEIYILDSKGQVLATTDEEEEGEDRSKDPYFINAQKEAYVKDVYFYEAKEKTIYSISAPIIDEETKTLLGVSVIQYSTDELRGIVARQRDLYKTEEAFLVNQDKYFVTPSKFLGEGVVLEQKEDTENTKACYDPQEVSYIQKNGYGGIVKAFGMIQTIEVKDYRQIDVWASHNYIPETNWCLVTKVDKAEVLKSINNIALIFVISLLSSLIFLFILGFGLAKKITKPLEDLQKGAEVIGTGNLDYKVATEAKDEIGQLSREFDKMTEKIKQSRVDIDRQVKEQIGDLVQKDKDLIEQKRAILNILEDEKEIEGKLVEEKAGVEKKVEERTRELKEEQARLTASIKGLPLGFIMIDNNHNIIMSNPAVEKILGISEITIKKISEKLGGKFELLAYCRKCQEEKKMINVKDIEYGQKFLTFLLAPVVMIRDHEEIIGTVIIIEDITEAKILERSKDEFFSIASHELRTPLTAIRGNTSLIQQLYGETLNKDKDLNEMIGDIHQASIRLITIVNDFLDISRLEVGKVQFKSESYDLSDLIQEVIKGYIVNAQEKNLYLRFEEPEKPLPKVFADKDRTRQVLVNLIGNSFKFTDKGGVTLQAQNIDGKFLKILVADTGQGISQDAQKLIFRKFQQAEQNIYTRDTSGGTGLGLYIAKLIVEGMGGKICLEKTEIGKGTVFSFTLPIASDLTSGF